MAEKKKIYKDEDFLYAMTENLLKESLNGEDYCRFYGAHTDYNGLDVKNLKNPVFEK